MTADEKDDSPLEWWEHIQVNIIEAIGRPEEAALFRKSPRELRIFRRMLKAAVTSDATPTFDGEDMMPVEEA